MKRFLAFFAALAIFAAALAYAADKPRPAPPLPPRVPEMNTAGTVLEVSESSLKIERTLKGKAETMEFDLEKPLANIAAGDSVKVSYREKDGRNVLIRFAPAQKTAVKKEGKKDLPKEIKPIAPSNVPATK